MFKIALAQYPIHFYKSEQDWITNLDSWFANAKKQDCQLVVFPEYGSMELISLLKDSEKMTLKKQLEKVQDLHETFLDLHIQMATKHSVYTVAPSFPLLVGNKYVNRTHVISPQGKFDFQDKINMTRFEENWGISSGEAELRIFDTRIGRFAVQICFDIEFSWASSLLAGANVHLILAPSCTEGFHGMNRVHVGARARALENQMYIGVSQVVGEAPWSLAVDKNNGFAAIYGPIDMTFPEDGVIAKGILNKPTWEICEIDPKKLEDIRTNGQVLNFKLNSRYPWGHFDQTNLKLKLVNLR